MYTSHTKWTAVYWQSSNTLTIFSMACPLVPLYKQTVRILSKHLLGLKLTCNNYYYRNLTASEFLPKVLDDKLK